MRKWILRWLFGSDAKDYDDMFRIACECHLNCKKMLETNSLLLEKYKYISDEQIDVLRALKDAKSIPDLWLEVMRIMKESRSAMDGGVNDA